MSIFGGRLRRKLGPVVYAVLWVRGFLSGSKYKKLVTRYQLDFMGKVNRYPMGIHYRFIGKSAVSEHSYSFRFQAPPEVKHHPGNTLFIRWQNSLSQVDELIATMGWTPASTVMVTTQGSILNPGGCFNYPLKQALLEFVDIRHPSAKLQRLLVPTATTDKSVSTAMLLEWIENQPSKHAVTPQQFIDAQPSIKPRSYSISDIEPRAEGDIIELLITPVEETKLNLNNELVILPGRCTSYLMALTPEQESILAWPLAFPLSLATQRVSAKPLLVIATGIAVASVLKEWQQLDKKQNLWLILGQRTNDNTQPFIQRLTAFASDHPQVSMDIALSRSSADSNPAQGNINWFSQQRVQDVLDQRAAQIKSHLNQGGAVVIIGLNSMGVAVKEQIKQLLVEAELAKDIQQAEEKMHAMEQDLWLQYSLSGL